MNHLATTVSGSSIRPAPVTALIAVAALVTTLVGCAESPTADSPTDHQTTDRATNGSSAADAPRVVSLSPALSETLVRVGLAESIVGRTPWCVAVEPAVPVVGDLMEVDAERLIGVAPTIVLVQPPRSGLDEGLKALAARHDWAIATWRIDGVDDILRVIDELPAAVLPEGSRRDSAETEARAVRDEIESALRPDPAVGAAGRTLLLFGIDPPMAFGAGSYLGEVLERLGGTNAVASRGFPQLTLEDLVRTAPDTVVLVGGATRSDRAREVLAAIGVPSDPSRVLSLDEPAALVPGPSLGRVATRLRTVLTEPAP